jgi:hypothetical protein
VLTLLIFYGIRGIEWGWDSSLESGAPDTDGVSEIGVQFAQSNPHFWRVSFPPADWSTHSPGAKRFASNPSAAPPAKNPVVKK